MKKRVKYIIIISFLLVLVFGIVNAYMNARDRKLEIERRDREKEDIANSYIIKRDNNLYTLKSEKLLGKNLKNAFYDGVCVYMVYTDSNSGTLIKYNVSNREVVVIFENNPNLKDGVDKFGKYYKIGNKLYDSNLEKSIDYPNINDGENLYPDLTKTIYSRDDGIYEKKIENGEETAIALNSDNVKYSIYKIDNSGYILLNKNDDGKNYITVLNSDFNEVSEFEKDDKKSEEFDVIDGKYILKTSTNNDNKTLYKIYDINTSSNIFTSDDSIDHLIFTGTKYVANKDGGIIMSDFLSGEERVLISKNNNKARWFPSRFILSDDSYSLLLTLDNNDRKFYIIYL